jgi:hypothetical protein
MRMMVLLFLLKSKGKITGDHNQELQELTEAAEVLAREMPEEEAMAVTGIEQTTVEEVPEAIELAVVVPRNLEGLMQKVRISVIMTDHSSALETTNSF